MPTHISSISTSYDERTSTVDGRSSTAKTATAKDNVSGRTAIVTGDDMPNATRDEMVAEAVKRLNT